VQGIAPEAASELTYDFVRIGIPLQTETEETGAAAQQLAMQKAQAALVENIEGFKVPEGIRSQESVGSQVSGELRKKGALAVGLALLMVLLYIWFRFEWQFGMGAVAALFHDVILTIGVFSLTQIEFNLSIIAAILTIVGYSLNDTVIVYDRIRENLRKYKKMPLPDVLNLSINDTLSRTILTSLTTLLALTALYVLGGQGLRGFSFAMIWGVFVGTYSSIFVASPLLMALKLKRGVNTGNKADA
jgi:preprotein translocase SecF subunit